MIPRTFNVLFICTGNSARSILAESLLNGMGSGRFRGYSAGSQPRGQVHPMALSTLKAFHKPTEGLSSKGWDLYAAPDAPLMDFVFTVCDQAAGEICPVWPGKPVTAHWGLPDPAAAPEARQGAAFQDALITLDRRIRLFTSLPLESLDAMSLLRQVQSIGVR
jgi:arsenate reductase